MFGKSKKSKEVQNKQEVVTPNGKSEFNGSYNMEEEPLVNLQTEENESYEEDLEDLEDSNLYKETTFEEEKVEPEEVIEYFRIESDYVKGAKRPKNGTVRIDEDGKVIGRAVYKRKSGFFGKFKKPDIEYEPPKEKKLYMLSEVVKLGMVQYLNKNHIQVVSLSSSPDELSYDLMYEEDPTRLVILDYGRGDFTDEDALLEIFGLIETVAGNNGAVTIFSNTQGFKTAILRQFKKDAKVISKIDINKFKGAVHIYETLRNKNEVYLEGGAEDLTAEDILNFKGVYEAPIEEHRTLIAGGEKMRYSMIDVDLISDEEFNGREDNYADLLAKPVKSNKEKEKADKPPKQKKKPKKESEV